ncbi:MAG: arsenate reductase ArsC [Bacteroidales bacterium]|nr:arsenate reductase ArsC [Bacteroidales bacterium]
MKVLILCTGNSCRSQMAHGFLQSFDKNLVVRSAGTEPAERVNPTTLIVMKEAGIDISNHTPAPVDKYLDEAWDYVITVCDHANETCPAFNGEVKQRLHYSFEDPAAVTGTEDYILDRFRKIRDQIREKFYGWYVSKPPKEF